ncbi:MAG: cation:dicarboxylase symporter family transporter [Sphingopyxis sp.]|nr:cation:dicarboxylase symporter family transporter [Sphingopyxis sp.]
MLATLRRLILPAKPSAVVIISALLIGIAIGAVAGANSPDAAKSAVPYVKPIGTLWLAGLQMTIIPLLVALLITGINAASSAARSGVVATRAVLTFVVLLAASATFAALVMPLILDAFPTPDAAVAAFRAAAGDTGAAPPVPTFGEFIATLLPSNVIAAASGDEVLKLVAFTTIFAFAMAQLPDATRAPLTAFFRSLGEAMLVVINWILALAPIGVFALGYAVAVETGLAALGGLAHYVAAVSSIGVALTLIAYGFAFTVARLNPATYSRAVLAPQAVAISTQSSLASLPAMLKASEAVGVPAERADVILPIAVALFRFTGPAMNLAVAIYVAHIFGIEPDALTLAVCVGVATMTSLASVSLPGTISFITAISPIAVAMGVPLAPLAILVAVEQLPDIFRTLGNVTMDVAVTAAIDKSVPSEETAP